jgi:aldose 1-epimerase
MEHLERFPIPTPMAVNAKPRASVGVTPFGRADGTDVVLYTLTNESGLVLKVTSYGATVTELHVPDRNGELADIVLGFGELDGYLQRSPYFGATCGRIGNRIALGKFDLDGRHYAVATNDGPHHLHGGTKGWDKVVWEAAPAETRKGPSIAFSYVSNDGEEGYPGTVTARAVYTLTNENELRIEMSAVTDRKTLVNMLHHSYFNLGGHGSGPITGHELTLNADSYTPGDPVIPNGVVRRVAGTPFDFTQPKLVGRDLGAAGATPRGGYDHNFIVNGAPNALRSVAKLKDPKSGRVMTIEADQPGVQFYSGNFLDGTIRGKGSVYERHAGLCLETQKFPNAINVPAWSNDVVLEPGTTYRHTMIHRFTTE